MANFAFFYNDDNGDREYDAESMTEWLKPFFTTGVFNGKLQVTANNDMSITVETGYCNIGGKVKNFTETTTLDLEVASGTLNRIDNVILRRDDTQKDIYLMIEKGGNAQTPTAPDLTRDGGIYDLKLAEIYVAAGTIAITQANITDTRMNADVCGWVASTVSEIEFDQIAKQFEEWCKENQADFEEWFEGVKGILGEDEAGQLLQLIEANTDSIDEIKNDYLSKDKIYTTYKSLEALGTSVDKITTLNGLVPWASQLNLCVNASDYPTLYEKGIIPERIGGTLTVINYGLRGYARFVTDGGNEYIAYTSNCDSAVFNWIDNTAKNYVQFKTLEIPSNKYSLKEYLLHLRDTVNDKVVAYGRLYDFTDAAAFCANFADSFRTVATVEILFFPQGLFKVTIAGAWSDWRYNNILVCSGNAPEIEAICTTDADLYKYFKVLPWQSEVDAINQQLKINLFGTDGWNGAPQFDLMPNDDPSAQLATLGMCYLSNENEIAQYNGPEDATNCYVHAFGMNTYRYAMLAIERGSNRMWVRTDTAKWKRIYPEGTTVWKNPKPTSAFGTDSNVQKTLAEDYSSATHFEVIYALGITNTALLMSTGKIPFMYDETSTLLHSPLENSGYDVTVKAKKSSLSITVDLNNANSPIPVKVIYY